MFYLHQLIFKRFYNGGSASGRTSLFALRNLVNWRDVMTDSHCRSAQCKRFMSLVLDADVIAAAFHFFGMESFEDAPSKPMIDSVILWLLEWLL